MLDKGGGTGDQQARILAELAFGRAQHPPDDILAQHEAMDIEAFVDDGNRAAEERDRSPRHGKHLQIACDDDIGLADMAELTLQRQTRAGDGTDSLGETAVGGGSEFIGSTPSMAASGLSPRRKPASVTRAPPATSVRVLRRTAGSARSCAR